MVKLFDMCIKPILLYDCEVWVYENIDILQKVHTTFCKFIFRVSTCFHNMPIYGELGRYPLSVTIKERMVCYWTKLLKSSKEKRIKVMYIKDLYNLYCKDVHLSPWIKCISNIFQTNDINYIWLMQDHNIDAKNIKKCECDQFKQLWHSRITNLFVNLILLRTIMLLYFNTAPFMLAHCPIDDICLPVFENNFNYCITV